MVSLIHDSVCLPYDIFRESRPGAPARSRIALEMQLHTEVVLQLFARVIIVHHSTWRSQWAAAGPGQPRAAGAPHWTQVVSHATDVGCSLSGGVAPPPTTLTAAAAAGASHHCR
jgi:hypothetical protein